MFVPIILGSDKTTVSVGTGNTEYWPVYGLIGNIHNNVRRAHRNIRKTTFDLLTLCGLHKKQQVV